MKDIVVSLTEVPPIIFSNESVLMWFRAVTTLSRRELILRVEQQTKTSEQERCPHERFFLFRRPEPVYLWARLQSLWGTETYMGRLCQDCNLFFLRKNENPWEECHLCGGTMIESGKETGPDQTTQVIYCCNRCQHETLQPLAIKNRAA